MFFGILNFILLAFMEEAWPHLDRSLCEVWAFILGARIAFYMISQGLLVPSVSARVWVCDDLECEIFRLVDYP